ncbi:4'-phosphopantetheinyl transferase superfamily protein [Streptomyces sp. NPDC005438]|uniref:4'-phosphopantetheinyl transferase family protein n=1 Tax=Streptomyces sp. NPDC005438 TaxID=3156880 RepID=UPI0033B02244
MIEKLLPSQVMVEECLGDPDPLPAMHPDEEHLVARAVDKRRREFTTVRHCARTALARLGQPAVPLLPGERGAPVWPDGVVGSMTHCDGYRAAAVASQTHVRSVGLDAEPNQPLPNEGVFEMISRPEEREWIRRLERERPEVSWGRLLFSAKESVYKTWFPLTRKWLDFDEASLTVDPDAGTFRAELLVPGPTVDGIRVSGFDGAWSVGEGLVVTAITLVAKPELPSQRSASAAESHG